MLRGGISRVITALFTAGEKPREPTQRPLLISSLH